MQPTEVFLSHASADHVIAERLSLQLRTHGVPTFFAPDVLIGGQQWQDEILKALNGCDWFVVLLSPDAIESMWVRRETAVALMDRRYENRIISLMCRSCDLGSLGWLKVSQIIPFQGSFDDGLRELLRVWGIGLRR